MSRKSKPILTPFEARQMYELAKDKGEQIFILGDLLQMKPWDVCEYMGIPYDPQRLLELAPKLKAMGWSADELQRVYELRRSGFTREAVADAMGKPHYAVRSICVRYVDRFIKFGKRCTVDRYAGTKAKVYEAWERGMAVKEIAKLVGISAGTIYKWLREKEKAHALA